PTFQQRSKDNTSLRFIFSTPSRSHQRQTREQSDYTSHLPLRQRQFASGRLQRGTTRLRSFPLQRAGLGGAEPPLKRLLGPLAHRSRHVGGRSGTLGSRGASRVATARRSWQRWIRPARGPAQIGRGRSIAVQRSRE